MRKPRIFTAEFMGTIKANMKSFVGLMRLMVGCWNLFDFAILFILLRMIIIQRGYFRRAFERIYNKYYRSIPSFLRIRILHLPDKNDLIIRMKKEEISTVYHIYYKRIYERLFKPEVGFTVVDIGAHIGIFTLKAAKSVGKGGLIIAIEPDPENYKLLIKNIKINNYSNVIPLNLACANFKGIGKLYIFSRNDAASLKTKSNKEIEVSVTKLDDLLNELKIVKIDFIKIDVERMELEILKGAKNSLAINANLELAIAAYHSTNEAQDIRHYLSNYNFEIYNIYEDEGPYIFARK